MASGSPTRLVELDEAAASSMDGWAAVRADSDSAKRAGVSVFALPHIRPHVRAFVAVSNQSNEPPAERCTMPVPFSPIVLKTEADQQPIAWLVASNYDESEAAVLPAALQKLLLPKAREILAGGNVVDIEKLIDQWHRKKAVRGRQFKDPRVGCSARLQRQTRSFEIGNTSSVQ